MRDGLSCGVHDHYGRLTGAEDGPIDREDAATSNTTDLRRARQKARAVVRSILDAIEDWMVANNINAMLRTDAGAGCGRTSELVAGRH